MATKPSVRKKPVAKKVVVKKAAAKKSVIKKPTARRKAPAKKQHIVKRILNFKIKGWISRKGLFISLGVLVLAVGSFAGFSLWQGMSADAGSCRTLGRNATTQQRIQFNKCVENQKANAAAAAKKAREQAAAASVARVAAAKQAEARAAAAKVAAANAAKAAATAAAAAESAKVAAAKAAEVKAAAAKGWTSIGSHTIIEDPKANEQAGSATVKVEACKYNQVGNSYSIRAKYTVVSSTPSTTSWLLEPSVGINGIGTVKGNPFVQSVGVTQILDTGATAVPASTKIFYTLAPNLGTMPTISGASATSLPSTTPSNFMWCP